MITNKNSVTYSNVSKRSEELESGGLTLTTNSIEKSFLFKSGVDVVKIDVDDHELNGIDNVRFRNGNLITGISDEYGTSSTIAASQKFISSLVQYAAGENIVFDSLVMPHTHTH
jgi:hypothetical protein